MNDHPISVTPSVVRGLAALRAESKFHEEETYPGAPDEGIRLRAEKAVNAMLDRLKERLSSPLKKSEVLAEFLEMLRHFEEDDTEERERACDYCMQVMDLLEIGSSDGLLSKWLYGFEMEG